MSSFKLKLDMAIQNLKGLYRRKLQQERALLEIDEKTDRITQEAQQLNERLTALALQRTGHQRNLESIQEYLVEIKDLTKALFWSQHGVDHGPTSLGFVEKDQIFSDFLVKNNIGGKLK